MNDKDLIKAASSMRSESSFDHNSLFKESNSVSEDGDCLSSLAGLITASKMIDNLRVINIFDFLFNCLFHLLDSQNGFVYFSMLKSFVDKSATSRFEDFPDIQL